MAGELNSVVLTEYTFGLIPGLGKEVGHQWGWAGSTTGRVAVKACIAFLMERHTMAMEPIPVV